MTAHRLPGPVRRAAGPTRAPRRFVARLRLALVAALAVGVVGMHALSSPVVAHHGHASEVHAAAFTAATGGCAGHGEPHDGPCPPGGHGHPEFVCQANPTGTGVAVPAPAATESAAGRTSPPRLPATADLEAGAGTGCGPPSLTQLSIART